MILKKRLRLLVPSRKPVKIERLPQDLVADEAKAIVGLPPDFLYTFMALANSMRLSLVKAAHADVGGAP